MNAFHHYDDLFDPIVVMGPKGELLYFNHQSVPFFKLSPRLLRQKTKLEEIFKSSEFDVKSWLQKGMAGTEPVISPEISIQLQQDPETEYFVTMKIIPHTSEPGSKYTIVFHDITVEKNLHLKYRQQLEELKKTHNQILQADKLTTLGELTANISHEINNPLTIAAGHSEIIHEFLKSNNVVSYLPRIQDANKNVMESLERVNQIIKNMKDFLHQSEDQKEYCDLHTLLNTAIEWIHTSAAKRGVNIAKTSNEQKIIALVNHTKIEQVLINLIKNSLDALSGTSVEKPEILISFSKSESDQLTIIDISDNGPGLPSEIKKHLFQPFTTTKDSGSGTGMGLSICKRIMESHNGNIEHLETPVGCTFRLTLPLIEIYSYSRNDKSLSGADKKKRILVLDNEAQILNVMNSFIQEEGLVFIGSSDPQDALSFLEKASIDLIITDFSMPFMNGGEFASRARENGYKGSILYMTGQKFIDQYNKDKNELMINGLIVKPFKKDEVMKTIHRALSPHEEEGDV